MITHYVLGITSSRPWKTPVLMEFTVLWRETITTRSVH